MNFDEDNPLSRLVSFRTSLTNTIDIIYNGPKDGIQVDFQSDREQRQVKQILHDQNLSKLACVMEHGSEEEYMLKVWDISGLPSLLCIEVGFHKSAEYLFSPSGLELVIYSVIEGNRRVRLEKVNFFVDGSPVRSMLKDVEIPAYNQRRREILIVYSFDSSRALHVAFWDRNCEIVDTRTWHNIVSSGSLHSLSWEIGDGILREGRNQIKIVSSNRDYVMAKITEAGRRLTIFNIYLQIVEKSFTAIDERFENVVFVDNTDIVLAFRSSLQRYDYLSGIQKIKIAFANFFMEAPKLCYRADIGNVTSLLEPSRELVSFNLSNGLVERFDLPSCCGLAPDDLNIRFVYRCPAAAHQNLRTEAIVFESTASHATPNMLLSDILAIGVLGCAVNVFNLSRWTLAATLHHTGNVDSYHVNDAHSKLVSTIILSNFERISVVWCLNSFSHLYTVNGCISFDDVGECGLIIQREYGAAHNASDGSERFRIEGQFQMGDFTPDGSKLVLCECAENYVCVVDIVTGMMLSRSSFSSLLEREESYSVSNMQSNGGEVILLPDGICLFVSMDDVISYNYTTNTITTIFPPKGCTNYGIHYYMKVQEINVDVCEVRTLCSADYQDGTNYMTIWNYVTGEILGDYTEGVRYGDDPAEELFRVDIRYRNGRCININDKKTVHNFENNTVVRLEAADRKYWVCVSDTTNGKELLKSNELPAVRWMEYELAKLSPKNILL